MAVVARGGMVGRLVASRQLGSWLVNQRYPPTAALSNTCVCFKEASSSEEPPSTREAATSKVVPTSNRLEDPQPGQGFQGKVSDTTPPHFAAHALVPLAKEGRVGSSDTWDDCMEYVLPHPIWTEVSPPYSWKDGLTGTQEEVASVRVTHRRPKGVTDRLAYGRWP